MSLLSAALNDRVEEAQLLLAKGGVRIEERKMDGCSALMVSAQLGHSAIVKMLLDKGANVEAKANGGDTPLHRAVVGGLKRIVQMLLDKGADPNVVSKDGCTPLHRAVQAMPLRASRKYPMLAVVRMLLDKGADVCARTRGGQTPEDLARLHASKSWIMAEATGLLRAVAKRRAECEAFAMGHHERLGARSLVGGVDTDVVRMILDRV